jgi:hypothetical protein
MDKRNVRNRSIKQMPPERPDLADEVLQVRLSSFQDKAATLPLPAGMKGRSKRLVSRVADSERIRAFFIATKTEA